MKNRSRPDRRLFRSAFRKNHLFRGRCLPLSSDQLAAATPAWRPVSAWCVPRSRNVDEQHSPRLGQNGKLDRRSVPRLNEAAERRTLRVVSFGRATAMWQLTIPLQVTFGVATLHPGVAQSRLNTQ